MTRAPGLHETVDADGWTTIDIVDAAGVLLWTSQIRTASLDGDTRGLLQAWASAQLRRAMRAERAHLALA